MITVYLLQSHFGYEELSGTQDEMVMHIAGKSKQVWYDVGALHPTTAEWERWRAFPTVAELKAYPPPVASATVALYQEDDAWPVPVEGEIDEEKRFWEFQGLYATSYFRAAKEATGGSAAKASGDERLMGIIAGVVATIATLTHAARYLL